MSRYFTYAVASIKAMPTENINKSKIGGIISNQLSCGYKPFSNANAKTTIKLKPRLIRAENELASTTRYLGILILRIRSPFATIEPAPIDVTSEKKLHNTTPRSNMTG